MNHITKMIMIVIGAVVTIIVANKIGHKSKYGRCNRK